MDPEKPQLEEGGALYQAGREAVVGPEPRNEDLVAFDQSFQETLNNLKAKVGEKKALEEMQQFLINSSKEVDGKLSQLLEQEKI